MPRPGSVIEKSKDFKGAMIRLIKNLNPWKYIMVMALSLALISAILALVAPNKLSDFADTISDGLIPKTEMIQKVSEEIGKNISFSLTQDKIGKLFTNVELSSAEANHVVQTFNKISNADKADVISLMLEFNSSAFLYANFN